MEMKEWLSIIVIIAIVLIVADGFRRKRARNPVRLKLEKTAAAEGLDDDVLLSAELPHGGARSIPRSQYSGKPPAAGGAKTARKAKKSRFGKKVPVLMESVDLPEGAVARSDELSPAQPEAPPAHASLQSERKRGNGDDDDFEDDWDEEEFDEDEDDFDEDDFDEDDFEEDDEDFDEDEDDDEDDFDGPRKGYDDDFDEDEDYDEDEDDFDDDDDDEEFGFGDDEDDPYESRFRRAGAADGRGRIEPSFGEEPVLSEEELADDRVAAAAASAARREDKGGILAGGRGREQQGELPLNAGQQAEKEHQEEAGGAPEKSVSPQEVIVINVMARKGEVFSGKDMLPVLMSQGLRLGDMSIFHRHADSSGNGPVLFSMANMVKPGTFDMARMEEFTTPGVSLFQQLPGPIDNMQCFERLLATANAIRDALHGDLKDENRSVLTRQTIEHYRQRIRDFELKQLAQK